MNKIYRTKVETIGNSPGSRIPRTILEQAGIIDEVTIKFEEKRLIIQAAHRPGKDWEERFAAIQEPGDEQLLNENPSKRWDEEEWTW